MIVTFRSSTGAIPITSWENVVYGGGRFFAQSLGSSFDGFGFANSPTGDFWNGIIPPPNFWNDLAYGEGKCALIGSRNDLVGTTYDGAYTEDFGDTWNTFQIEPTQRLWENIAFGAGKWIAMTNGRTVAVSNDSLLTWQTADLPEACEWEDIVYGDGLWVAVSPDATQGKVMTSTDGLNWTQGPTPDETQSWKSVTYGNGRFVAVACDFADATSSTMWSDDGINWNIVSPVVNSLWVKVAYGKGQFVAVSINDIAMSSSDFGLTWDLADTPTGTFRWRSIAYGEDVFVAVADFAGSSGQGNRSMLATGTGNDPSPPPRPPGEILSPKEQIEDLFLRYNDGTDYIRIVRDGTDYVVTTVGSYEYRGKFKIRVLDSNGYLRASGTNGKWLPVSEVRDYEQLYTYPFPNNGLDDSPTPPYNPNLSRIVSNYSPVDGYGQFSVEYALEDLQNVNLPNQPSVADQFTPGTNMYNLDAIGAPEAWAAGYTGDGIIVAVLDTGVDVTHVELDDNLWVNVGEIPNNGIDDDGNGYIDDINGWDFVNNDNSLEDLDGHGTHVAGTVSAENNGIGIVGAAFDAKIMPVKILPGTDDGGSYFNLALGIYYAVDNGAHVINMSLGGGYVPPQVIRDAIKYANDNGVICVMAAGNDFDANPDEATSPQAPGNYASEYGIVVGATNESVDMTTFSNRAGQPVDWDDDGKKELLYVTASGKSIWSTLPNDALGTKNGTSMAAPLVAAACAILLQADPTLTPDQIRVLLANNTI